MDKHDKEKIIQAFQNGDEELIKALKKRKKPITIKDGIAQIDKSHPDYDFLMED